MPSRISLKRRALCEDVEFEALRRMATEPVKQTSAYLLRKMSPRAWVVRCVEEAAASIGGLTQAEITRLCRQIGREVDAGHHVIAP